MQRRERTSSCRHKRSKEISTDLFSAFHCLHSHVNRPIVFGRFQQRSAQYSLKHNNGGHTYCNKCESPRQNIRNVTKIVDEYIKATNIFFIINIAFAGPCTPYVLFLYKSVLTVVNKGVVSTFLSIQTPNL